MIGEKVGAFYVTDCGAQFDNPDLTLPSKLQDFPLLSH